MTPLVGMFLLLLTVLGSSLLGSLRQPKWLRGTYLPTYLCHPVHRPNSIPIARLATIPVLSITIACSEHRLAIRQTTLSHSSHRHPRPGSKKAMCIKLLVQYACGHAEVEFMNLHCECALIVGPVVERRGRCRRVCGGGGR